MEKRCKVIIVMDGMGNGQRMRNGTNDSGPDPDAIKMFVGQVPRTMDEVLCGCFHINLFPPSCQPSSPFLNVSLFQEELREFFGEFGPIHQLNILRDKSTGVSRWEKKLIET